MPVMVPVGPISLDNVEWIDARDWEISKDHTIVRFNFNVVLCSCGAVTFAEPHILPHLFNTI